MSPRSTVRALVAVVSVLVVSRANSQESAPPTRLKEAIAGAVASFAQVRAGKSDLSAAGEGVELAKKAYLPGVDLYLQWNDATRNNVFGLLLPGGNVPSISGPALEQTTSRGTFGSVAAALVHWEAVDFGARAAGVRQAEALRRRAEAGLRVTELEVSMGAMDSFLSVVAGDATVRAAEATVHRMEVFSEMVSVLAQNDLRPGADLSLARAELARARTELIRAEGIREQARVTLAEWLGRTGQRIDVDGAELLTLPSAAAPSAAAEAEQELHPLVQVGAAERDAAEARRDAAAAAYRPKVDLLAALYARGSGALLDGTFEGGSAGLWPETSNWALGVAVRFPLLDFVTRQETKMEEYRQQAAEARYENTRDHMAAELERAQVGLDAAERVAENTPAELEAARALQTQARARYDAGLAPVLEVAEAERTLQRAETEDALARLQVWRSRFAVASAEGDLEPVLSQLK